ncbi:SulP family inorganic anion transporter [Thiomicrorhabdus heinhorstiae]|uniref:SulP family inorganic anion transporter n=1 Tax=Thiomicrorhabdus heinhorstiae TaxID=2748010 RepID=A0ABS0BZK0_9GAMM|nr:SulP family inorganic anion transporter [Thiomicrorhabdus heinhorstiae]MBF6058475.1 SulP family inorganic anion transporter [Thiomicrorhabdus heinhorstiae]
MSAIIALPIGLALGIASGLGIQAGIFSAVLAGAVSAIFGGTPGQYSGPTGAVAVTLALSLAHLSLLYPNSSLTVLTLGLIIVVLAGLFQILFGLMKWGQLIEYLPHSVISGLLSAIGLMLMLEQLPLLFGGQMLARPLDSLLSLPDILQQPNWLALAFGATSFMLMVIWPKYLPKVNRILPAPVLILVLGTALAYGLSLGEMTYQGQGWQAAGLSIIGPITFAWPEWIMPPLEGLPLAFIVQSAFALALIGSLVSLLGSLVAERLTRKTHNPDQELIGQGLGNIASGLVGGMPSTGAPMRTNVAFKYGARDRWTSIVHSCVIGIVAFSLSDLISFIPLAVFGGLLLKIGLDQVDWDYLRRWSSIPKSGRTMMLSVIFSALLLDLMTALWIGILLASIVLMKRMKALQIKSLILGRDSSSLGRLWLTAEEKRLLDDAKGKLALLYLDVPMSFGAAKTISRRILDTDAQAFVLDLRSVPYIDFSSAMVLEDLIYRLQIQNKEVWLLLMVGDVQDSLQKHGVLKRLNQRILFDRAEALKQANDSLVSQ